jgi:hypothetical protein
MLLGRGWTLKLRNPKFPGSADCPVTWASHLTSLNFIKMKTSNISGVLRKTQLSGFTFKLFSVELILLVFLLLQQILYNLALKLTWNVSLLMDKLFSIKITALALSACDARE